MIGIVPRVARLKGIEVKQGYEVLFFVAEIIKP